MVTITAVEGTLTIKDDLKDYIDRGATLANCNFLDFFLNTYDRELLPPPASNQGCKLNEQVPMYIKKINNSSLMILEVLLHDPPSH
jgi:hypothetical protein